MEDRTPEQWLAILIKRNDAQQPGISKLRKYAGGDADMPEMGKNLKESWLAFQKKARTDFGGLAVSALATRIKVRAIRVGDSDDSPAAVAARRIWRDNRMAVALADAIGDYLTTRIGYLVCLEEDGKAVLTREKPEDFYAEPDPLHPWRARAAVKIWRDSDRRMDFAKVLVPTGVQLFSRSATDSNGSWHRGAAVGDWQPNGDFEPNTGGVTVIILKRPVGLFEPHIDVIDRINLGKLQRLVTTAMQAFRQRALRARKEDGSSGPLPTEDEDGNTIDYSKVFEHAPGALWELPEGFDIWESQVTDIRPMLEAEKADARDFAAVSSTPISMFLPDSANQTATGAAAAKDAHVSKAEDEIERIKPGLAVLLVYALRVEGVDLEGQTIDVDFVPPATVSLTEKYAAAQAAKAAGESWGSIARNILGYTTEQIAQDAQDRAEEQLAIMSLTQPEPTTPVVTPPAVGQQRASAE